MSLAPRPPFIGGGLGGRLGFTETQITRGCRDMPLENVLRLGLKPHVSLRHCDIQTSVGTGTAAKIPGGEYIRVSPHCMKPFIPYQVVSGGNHCSSSHCSYQVTHIQLLYMLLCPVMSLECATPLWFLYQPLVLSPDPNLSRGERVW